MNLLLEFHTSVSKKKTQKTNAIIHTVKKECLSIEPRTKPHLISLPLQLAII